MKTYEKTFTREDFEGLSTEEWEALCERARNEQLWCDPLTFQPYMVIDKVRYDIEPGEKEIQC